MIDTVASLGARGRLALPQGVVLAALCLAAVVSGFGPRPLERRPRRWDRR